ncbi:TetR/AcrR family transcriptional regulator [Sphingomonas sp. CJ20]
MSDRLIAAALALLDSGEEFSLRSVARAAGVSAMAPYRHFADKDALLGAVAAHGFDELRDTLREADAAPDPRTALLAQGMAYVRFALGRPALFRLMFGGAASGPPPSEDTAYGVLARRMADLLPDDAQTGSMTCWATVHGLATLALDGRLGPAPEPVAHAALALMVSGLAAPAR